MDLRRSLIVLHACAGIACASSPTSAPPAATAVPVYTVDGRVLGTESTAPPAADASVRLILQPDGQAPMVVEMAPGWYLDRRGLHFSEQERLSVDGRREGPDSSFVARRVRQGELIVDLRDDNGQPLWTAPSPAGKP
jgi:hypothetical protein